MHRLIYIQRLCVALIIFCFLVPEAVPVYAFGGYDESENVRGAYWGSVLRDFLCDDEGYPLVVTSPASDFELEINDTPKNIESVRVVGLDRGPGKYKVTSGTQEKFIVVEILLATPLEVTTDEFFVDYTVTCKYDIYDREYEVCYEEGESFDGSWSGRGDYVRNVVIADEVVTNRYDGVVWESSTYGAIDTVMSFGEHADLAVRWESDEPAKYMGFSTNLSECKVALPPGAAVSYINYIRFKAFPTFKNEFRLVIYGDYSRFVNGKVYQIIDNQLYELSDAWYNDDLYGFVIAGRQLGEYIISSTDLLNSNVTYDEDGNLVRESTQIDTKEPDLTTDPDTDMPKLVDIESPVSESRVSVESESERSVISESSSSSASGNLVGSGSNYLSERPILVDSSSSSEEDTKDEEIDSGDVTGETVSNSSEGTPPSQTDSSDVQPQVYPSQTVQVSQDWLLKYPQIKYSRILTLCREYATRNNTSLCGIATNWDKALEFVSNNY